MVIRLAHKTESLRPVGDEKKAQYVISLTCIQFVNVTQTNINLLTT